MSTTNPFFSTFETEHATPPFSKIGNAHFLPAIERGIAIAREEIKAITDNSDTPTFANTIEALARSGEDLNRVAGVFYPLLSAESNPEMLDISMKVAPMMSDFSTSIVLNRDLWERIRYVHDHQDISALSPEQATLLSETYDSFARSGALLEGDDREEYRRLSGRLSELTTLFGQNVLKEMAALELALSAADLDGLPQALIDEAAAKAHEKGLDGRYVFTLDAPVYIPFMKNSSRRDLRERMWRLYTGRNTKGEFDNTAVLAEIADLRRRIASLLGSPDFASHSLKHTMAGEPAKVWELLDRLSEAYREPMLAEMKELSEFAADLEGKPLELRQWDYSYYANKLKASRYAFDEEELRPYFELSQVIKGVFGLASRLYGIQFVENTNIDVYHPDVKAYDVVDADGSFLGVLFADFFPRQSKRQGAWMTNFAEQYIDAEGNDHRPQVSIVMNFTKPGADRPSLLTPNEVGTFLHEFGHSLHGLLARGSYNSLSGTGVYRDFVELPSQFNENYLTEKEWLDSFAAHYLTGQPIPAEMIERMVKAQRYGAAYACMRQLMFGFLDMRWHSITAPVADVAAFEAEAIAPVQIFPPVEGSLTSPQFSHIFSGGYAAGYYSYKWAEVLDADAFSLFKQNGIFDPATARSFRTNILEKGGSENPAVLYRRFRGQEPTIDALLRRDGIIK